MEAAAQNGARFKVMPASIGANVCAADEGETPRPLVNWALALTQLGWAGRVYQDQGYRFLFVAILPTRRLASAFAALGAVFAGGESFATSFGWDEFRSLPPGSMVFWLENNRRFQGEILPPIPGASHLACILVRGGDKARVGSVWAVSCDVFETCGFSVEQVPTLGRQEDLANLVSLHKSLGLGTPADWVKSPDAEAVVVGNQSRFDEDARSVSLSVRGGCPVSLSLRDALGVCSKSGGGFGKVRAQSPGRQALESDVPFTIFDGPLAANQLEGMFGGNYLVLLEYGEFSLEFRNRLLGLSGEASEAPTDLSLHLPARVPRGINLAGYAFRLGG